MTDQKIQPSFYANIPATVRYDKNLCANAKLLYGEITALTNQHGYAWAGNEYFAELYDVSLKTVSRWISQLENEGYIKRVMKYKNNSKEIQQRRIYLNQPNVIIEEIGGDKNDNTYGQKCPIGGDKKAEDNNTLINTTLINIKDNVVAKTPTAVSKNVMPDEMVNLILGYFNEKMNKKFTKSDTTVKLLNALYKAGHKDIAVYQYVMDNKYAEWINNDRMKNRLVPGTLFSKANFEKYIDEEPFVAYSNNKHQQQLKPWEVEAYNEPTTSWNDNVNDRGSISKPVPHKQLGINF